MKTALKRLVKPASAGIDAVEKFSAQAFIDGPAKSNAAASAADQERTIALCPPRFPATRISVVARASGNGSLPWRSRTK